MSTVYRYPKARHKRALRPRRAFKNYRRFKPILQAEFSRVCVYCRQPDSQHSQLTYTVDHYKPKSIAPELACDYDNLFYCCHQCNTYKGVYWPAAKTDLRLINPCADAMAVHVKFDKDSGEMVALSVEGDWLISLLRLNEDGAPRARLEALAIIKMGHQSISQIDEAIRRLDRRLAGDCDENERSLLEGQREKWLAERTLCLDVVSGYEGTKPLRKLSKRYIA